MRQLLEREKDKRATREGENERCVMCFMFSEQENAVQVCESENQMAAWFASLDSTLEARWSRVVLRV